MINIQFAAFTSSIWFEGHVMVGGITSFCKTIKEQDPVLPALSVAFIATETLPVIKVPGAGTWVTVKGPG
jgi:hypothetical protein